MVHAEILSDLREPLLELGRRWSASIHRPRPSFGALKAWDELLACWLKSDLPLVLRDSRRRGLRTKSITGREIVFADNTPANWVFSMALDDQVPDITLWSSETLHKDLPLTFLTKGAAAKRDLNKKGWKVCHIEDVSDRKRYAVETAQMSALEAEFKRFLSPRNIFLVPKALSGAGELQEVIAAIVEFEKTQEASAIPAQP